MDVSEVARSIELYRLGKYLQDQADSGNVALELTREPLMRKREDVRRVAAAFGSYDPLSRAHEALFLKGLSTVQGMHKDSSLDELLIVTSTVHFDKKIDLQKNSAVYDRVHALEGFAICQGNVSLAFFNNPYFVNLIPAIEEKYRENVRIYFLVGADVMQKVVDPKGYSKRGIDINDILPKLFKHNFIVSERCVSTRKGKEIVSLDDLKKSYPVLKSYEDKIMDINIQGDYEGLEIPIQDVSSTLIRAKRDRGEDAGSMEAVGISDFVDKRSLYLNNSTKYAAFVCARQRFADEHPGEPIAAYIPELMDLLLRLDNDPRLRAKEVSDYEARKR